MQRQESEACNYACVQSQVLSLQNVEAGQLFCCTSFLALKYSSDPPAAYSTLLKMRRYDYTLWGAL